QCHRSGGSETDRGAKTLGFSHLYSSLRLCGHHGRELPGPTGPVDLTTVISVRANNLRIKPRSWSLQCCYRYRSRDRSAPRGSAIVIVVSRHAAGTKPVVPTRATGMPGCRSRATRRAAPPAGQRHRPGGAAGRKASVAGRRGGLAHHESGVDEAAVGDRLVLDGGQQLGESQFTEAGEGLAHGGQRRQEVAGIGQIVEPDHADVIGNAQAAVPQAVNEPQGHLIVRSEDRRDTVEVLVPPDLVPR